MWIVVFLAAIIIILIGVILFGGGVTKQRKLRGEINALKEELRRAKEANEAVRRSIGAGPRAQRYEDLVELAKDLDCARSAIAGSKICQMKLTKKYNMNLGPQLLDKILVRYELPPALKQGLADEILVGEVGKAIMRSLNAGNTLGRAAEDAGIPLVVAKGQVRRLQILGYLDGRLKPTARGQEALELFKL